MDGGEALRQLQYKSQWHGRTIGASDRWFPSSKQCSTCGHVLEKLPLDMREWTFPSCGVSHQRYVNAAKNILTVGQMGIARVETATGEEILSPLGKFR